MNCPDCGSYIAPGKRFCADCGAPALDPEMTRIARAQSSTLARNDAPDEMERPIFNARPTLLFIGAGYVAAALGAILLTVLLAKFIPGVPAYISLLCSLALFLIPAYYHLKRNMINYTLTDSKIVIDQGLIARTTRNVPLRNIQDVTVQASIPQRLLGFGDVIIDNASEQGGKIVLHNITKPRQHADQLLRELRRWR